MAKIKNPEKAMNRPPPPGLPHMSATQSIEYLRDFFDHGDAPDKVLDHLQAIIRKMSGELARK